MSRRNSFFGTPVNRSSSKSWTFSEHRTKSETVAVDHIQRSSFYHERFSRRGSSQETHFFA